MGVLEGLKPEGVFRFFEEICGIPHGSGNVEAISGYLAAMAALADDPAYDVGDCTEYSSKVQAACPWYPPTDVSCIPYGSEAAAAVSNESQLLGKNVMLFREEALGICPVSYVTKDAPPFMIIHGTDDHTVPFMQGEVLHDKLEAAGRFLTSPDGVKQ